MNKRILVASAAAAIALTLGLTGANAVQSAGKVKQHVDVIHQHVDTAKQHVD